MKPMVEIICPGPSLRAGQNALGTALLSFQPVVLKNFPQSPQLEPLLEVLRFLGASIVKEGKALVVDAASLNISAVPPQMAPHEDAFQLLVGPLLARFKKVAWPQLSPKLKNLFPPLGIKLSSKDGFTLLEGQIESLTFELPEKDGLLTLVLVLASLSAKGEVVLRNVSQEPEVEDTFNLLRKMGANISYKSENNLIVQPFNLKDLEFTEHQIINDRHQAVRAVCRVLSKGEEAHVKGINVKYLTAFLSKLDAAGISYKITDNDLYVWIEDPASIQPIEIKTGPYPKFEEEWREPFENLLRTYQS